MKKPFALVLVAAVATAGSVFALQSWEQVVGSSAPVARGFGDPNNTVVSAATVFNERLYLATRNVSTGAELWSSQDGVSWTQINSDGFGDPANLGCYALVAFDGYLYAATANSAAGTEVWRSSDGSSWMPVTANGFGDAANTNISSAAAFDGSLFMGTTNANGTELWSSSNGTTWAQVNSDGFGDAGNNASRSMTAFGSFLYVGTENGTTGGEIWRSNDGATWNQVNSDGFGSDKHWAVQSMAALQSRLYAGTSNSFNGTSVWRSDDGTTWLEASSDGFGDAANERCRSMAAFEGYLYMGARNDSTGAQIWRRAPWRQTNSAGFGDPGNTRPTTLTVFGEHLYAGTLHGSGCELWRLPGGPPAPRGDDSQVNSHTLDAQWSPAVGISEDGNSVVVWTSWSSTGTDNSGSSIQARRFGADGTPLGDDVQVNTAIEGNQNLPAVATTGDGGFVVVWSSDPPPTSLVTIKGQRFDDQGSPLGEEFLVAEDNFSGDGGAMQHTALATASDGGFVVAWRFVEGYNEELTTNVSKREFASDGSPLGPEFVIDSGHRNYYIDTTVDAPSLAIGANENFVVVWRKDLYVYPTGGAPVMKARQFAADGTPVGPPIQISDESSRPSIQNDTSVAATAAGEWLALWETGASLDIDVEGRRLAADATPIGPSFQANTFTSGRQKRPSVSTIGGSGDLLVTWQSEGSFATSDGFSIQAMLFDAYARPIGSDFQVNTTTSGDQERPAVAANGSDDLIIVWDSETPASDLDIMARRYAVSSRGILFRDGFESGDTSAWSMTVP